MNTNFKTALFGGFDREDVVSYIQQTSRENQQRVSALEEENHGLQERNRAMEAELNTLRRAVLENSAAADTCLQLQTQLRELQEQAQKLQKETEYLRAQAAEYQSLKDHIADIEISAHRRTEEFRAKAIEELRTMARRQEEWCAQSRDKYAELNRQFCQKLALAQQTLAEPDLSGFQEMEAGLRQLAAAMVDAVRPASLICVDSLCSAEAARLGRTIQFSDTGLHPADARHARHLDAAALGVPVIAAGIPTLMDADEGADLVLTPRALDSVIAHGSALLAGILNRALQPRLSVAQLCWLTG